MPGVTALAERFAKPFGGAALARYAGLLHDLGKLTPGFQKYLYDCAAGVKRRKGSAPHKQHGARAALDDLFPVLSPVLGKDGAALVASVLHGHHGGILHRAQVEENMVAKGASSEAVAKLRATARRLDPRLDPSAPALDELFPAWAITDKLSLEMYLRFVFSCLVDADCLDTEAHTTPEAAARRAPSSPTPTALRDRLRERQQEFAHATGPVNEVRRAVHEHCLRAACEYPPGVFSLSVPTGGGKTRSSLAFGLEHAVRHGLHRVVYAIPYTSIVDQTAQEFRGLFAGMPGAVLEHHSAIDTRRKAKEGEEKDEEGDDEAEEWRRLAAQNWDASLVVTTTVQLFESLFSNRPAACRKLHRLAGSVVVLDEAQTLPPTLLAPLLSGLRALVERFGATVVLCTATQPELSLQTEHLQGFPKITPIVPDAEARAHFQTLKRVRFRVEEDAWDWPQVAAEMQKGTGQALCVVNTRRQALDLLAALNPNGDDADVLHLSTLLCGAHRRAVLDSVRARLKNGQPILLASTQTIEAGVDVDFPRVLRALGPLDRIIQAAGRCNREGLRPRDESEVIVFTPTDDKSPPGIYERAMQKTVQMFRAARARGREVDFDDPQIVKRYFAQLYMEMEGGVDKGKVQDDREHFRYPDVAKKVRLIEDETVSVLVTTYDTDAANAILAESRRSGRMTRDLWRRAQPLCVSIYAHSATHLVPEESGLLVWPGTYNDKRGIDLPDDPADAVVYKPDRLMG